jgi:hypothetical protein
MEDDNNNNSSLQNYYIEHYTAMLLNEAEKIYNKLVKDLTNRIILGAAVNSNE